MIDAFYAALNRWIAGCDPDDGFDLMALVWTFHGRPVLAFEDFIES